MDHPFGDIGKFSDAEKAVMVKTFSAAADLCHGLGLAKRFSTLSSQKEPGASRVRETPLK
jgi:hypothetical protein